MQEYDDSAAAGDGDWVDARAPGSCVSCLIPWMWVSFRSNKQQIANNKGSSKNWKPRSLKGELKDVWTGDEQWSIVLYAELLNKHIMFIVPFMRMKFMKIWRETNGPQSEGKGTIAAWEQRGWGWE